MAENDWARDRSKGLDQLPASKAKATRAVAVALLQPRYDSGNSDPEKVSRMVNAIIEITARFIPTAVMFKLPAKELGALIDGVAEAESSAYRRGWQACENEYKQGRFDKPQPETAQDT